VRVELLGNVCKDDFPSWLSSCQDEYQPGTVHEKFALYSTVESTVPLFVNTDPTTHSQQIYTSMRNAVLTRVKPSYTTISELSSGRNRLCQSTLRPNKTNQCFQSGNSLSAMIFNDYMYIIN